MTALEHVIAAIVAEGLVSPDEAKSSIYDFLCDRQFHEQMGGKHRWYIDTFCVALVGGKEIGFESFEATGDGCDGWEFDEKTVCFVEKYEVVEVQYRRAG